MDRDHLAKRISELETQKEQVIAHANALHGAIQECRSWLDKLDAEQEEALAPPALHAVGE